jgi:hypothetical protein
VVGRTLAHGKGAPRSHQARHKSWGGRIAFIRQEDGGGAFRLYVLNLRTRRVTPLTPDERYVSSPSWKTVTHETLADELAIPSPIAVR